MGVTAAFSCVMVLGSTYSWLSSAASEKNSFEGTRLAAEIEENFKPNLEWSPGKQTNKEVWVRNTGQVDAFIRVAFDEFLVSFKMDVLGQNGKEGTANVVNIKPKPTEATVLFDDVTTWKIDDFYHKKVADQYYQAVSTVPPTLGETGKGYRYGQDNVLRDVSDLTYTTLDWGEVIEKSPTLTTNYWRYGNDGYFYYSERVSPGEATSHVLEGTTLSRSVPNRLKDSLYQLVITMDAQQPVSETFSDWGHDDVNDPIYQMLKDKLSDS